MVICLYTKLHSAAESCVVCTVQCLVQSWHHVDNSFSSLFPSIFSHWKNQLYKRRRYSFCFCWKLWVNGPMLCARVVHIFCAIRVWTFFFLHLPVAVVATIAYTLHLMRIVLFSFMKHVHRRHSLKYVNQSGIAFNIEFIYISTTVSVQTLNIECDL